MNKKFEYVDDNPGAYFSMLVESFEDKKELKESIVGNAKDWLIYKEGKSPKETEKILNSLNPEEIEEIALKWLKQRKLKEDKFVPQDKMSKKAQKELNDKKRGTWGNTNPVTRVQPNKKAYDRKRDKKVVDEAKETFSSLSELADKIDKLSAVSMAYEDDGKIKIKGRWRKSTRQSNNDYVSINSSLKKLLGDKKYKLVFENIDSRDGGKEFSAQLSLTVPKVVVESLTEDSEVFKDMSNALDDITYLCNDTYNWDIDEWNDKKNVKNTAERIIDSANVLLDSIKKY